MVEKPASAAFFGLPVMTNDSRALRVWEYLQDTYLGQCEITSRESRQDYEIQVGHFCAWWLAQQAAGGYRPPMVTDLSRAVIQQCRAWKQGTAAIATANKLKRVLLAVANHAAERGLCPFPGRIRNLKEPQREPRAWSLDEYGRIVATAGDLVGEHVGVPLGFLMPAFYRFAYDCGARIETLLACRWDWLSLASRECLIPAECTKDKQEIAVELSRGTVDSLIQLQVYRLKTRSELVFGVWNESTFRRLHKRIVYAAIVDPKCDFETLKGKFRQAAEKAVGRAECFHKIRRTTCTEICAVAGESVASKALGHSSINVTRRYLDRRRLKQTVQASQRPEIPELIGFRVVRAEEGG